MGDKEFVTAGASAEDALAWAQPFFDCAHQIEDSQPAGDRRRVIWYLISDSLALRQAAAAHYGPKRLVTDTAAAALHTDCKRVATCGGDEAAQAGVMQLAAGQLLSMMHTDIQVLPDTRHS